MRKETDHHEWFGRSRKENRRIHIIWTTTIELQRSASSVSLNSYWVVFTISSFSQLFSHFPTSLEVLHDALKPISEHPTNSHHTVCSCLSFELLLFMVIWNPNSNHVEIITANGWTKPRQNRIIEGNTGLLNSMYALMEWLWSDFGEFTLNRTNINEFCEKA